MIKVGEQGIYISNSAAKKLSPYNLSQFKKTLVLDLNALQSFTESDPVFTAWLATPPNVSTFTNDAGYLTSFSEIDPIFTAWQTLYDNHTDWDTAYSWGNHASVGYLTSSALTPYLTSATAASTYQPIGSYLTSISSSNVITALGYTPYDSANPSGYITSSSLSSYVPNTRTLTINGTTYDLSSNRSWTISTGTTYTFSTGLTNTAGTITSNLSTGVSGGQSVIGGTASGNNLTLSSTSNATKGKILFGTSAYDEVNNRLGIGTNAPSAKLEVRGISDFWGLQVGNGTVGALFQVNGGNAEFVGFNGSAYNSLDIRSGISTQLFLATNGKVGIGTNSPSVGDFGSTFTVKGTGSEIGIITAQRNVSAVANGTGFQTVLNNASSNPVTYSYFNGYIITNTAGAESGGLMFFTRNAGTLGARMTILNDGNTGIGTTSPTAYLHLKAGTATANTAPLKFTTGTNTTVAVAGQMEYNNTFHLTNSDATRRHIVTAPNTTKVTASAPYTNDGYIVVNIAGTDFKILTTA